MRWNRISTALIPVTAVVLLAGVASISAQDRQPAPDGLVISPPPGLPQTGAPRDNVGSGAVSSRAPGQVVQESIRRHNAWQDTSLPYYDTQAGEAPGSGQNVETFLIDLLNSIFDALFAIITGLGSGGAAGGGAGGGA